MKYLAQCTMLLGVAVGLGLGLRVQARTNAPTSSARFVIREWQTGSGLPQNTVNAMLQTRDGYLWLGTQAGLARFDGVRFTVLGLSDGLPSIQVRVLYQDQAGDLWIGTTGGGLSRLRDGSLTTFSAEHGLADVNVTALAEDTQRRLWIGTSAGLSLRQGDKFIQLEALAGLGHVPIRALLCEPTGTVWIATSQGLFEFNTNHLSEITGPRGDEKITIVYSLLKDLRDAPLDGEVKVRSADAMNMTCRLHREFGLLVGTSSGANVVAALSVARELGPQACVVTMLCDRAERYFSTQLFAGQTSVTVSDQNSPPITT